MNFNTLLVKELKKESADSVSITFDIPSHLEREYSFQAGQYITIEKEINGEKIRRAYSIWKAPFEKEISVLVKKIENGLFSTYANEILKEGDQLSVSEPQGNFKLVASQGKTITLFAAGSGITPILSIAKQQLSLNDKNKVVLFYVNKTTNDIIFKEELEQLSNKFGERFTVHHLLTREDNKGNLFSGRINTEKCQELLNSKALNIHSDDFYMCGPEEMVIAIKDFLLAQNRNSDAIHFELFTTSEKSNVFESKIEHATVFVTIDDDEFEFEYTIADSPSLMDAGNDSGLDLPFSCKGGVCCTCKAKVMEGEAKMIKNYALDENEVEEGYILTCQSHPTTEKLVISFDE